MPRGQKDCPKCNVSCGPRTKVCVCGHVYIKESANSLEESDDFDVPNVRALKRNCANCGLEFESINFKIDAYGTVTHSFRFEHYCSSNCLEESSERKDDLLEELLRRQDLEEFFEAKCKDSDYKTLFGYILNREVKEKKLSDYLDNHPKITFTTFPKKRILTVRDCEEVGIKAPPKIGDYKGSEPEAPELSKLERFLFKKEKVDLKDDDEEQDLVSNSNLENEDEDEENFGDTIEEEKPSSLASLLGLKMTSPVVPSANPIVNVGVDTVSMPRQGQKKCGWKNKVYTGKGCGLIVGVRTGNCPKCNYQF